MNFFPYNNHQAHHSGFATQQALHSPQFYPTYSSQQHHMYNMHRRATSMTDLGQVSRTHADKNDTKPRLSKAEVELLEQQFQEQHKPSSNTKRQLADQMCVDIARINNWFQNRRAKAKLEKKHSDLGLRDAGNLSYSEPSSPDLFTPNGYFEGQLSSPENNLIAFPNTNEIAAPAAPFPPRYENPAAASMDSLHRTLMAAEAAISRGEFDDVYEEQQLNEQFEPSIPYDGFPNLDRARFPMPSTHTMGAFQFDDGLIPTDGFVEPLLTQPLELEMGQDVQGYGYFAAMPDHGNSLVETSLPTFPSQLLVNHGEQDLTPRPFQPQAFAEAAIKSESQPYPPPMTMESRFKSPPPPADLATRRSKPRPAALGTSALRDKTSTGPKTCNNAETVKRMHGSPAMRRVSSATGLNSSATGMNVLAGRIQKSGQIPPRSPMKRNFSAGPNSFTEQNAHIKQMPLRNRAWLARTRGPPTPRSPLLFQDGTSPGSNQQDEKTHEDEQSMPDHHTPSSSQYESDSSYVLENSLPGSLATSGLISLASPPETPGHSHGPIHWGYDVPDDALLTPGFGDGFMQMPQPVYVSPLTASQPATPAFGPYAGFPFSNHSPVFDMAPNGEQGMSEYFFADGISLPPMVASTQSPAAQPKEKTYTFSNATPKDYES